MKEHGIEEVVGHAPYIINLANTTKKDILILQLIFKRRIETCRSGWCYTGCSIPGSRRGWCRCKNKPNHLQIKSSFDERPKVQIALETMAVKGQS